jgi:amino acid transporter
MHTFFLGVCALFLGLCALFLAMSVFGRDEVWERLKFLFAWAVLVGVRGLLVVGGVVFWTSGKKVPDGALFLGSAMGLFLVAGLLEHLSLPWDEVGAWLRNWFRNYGGRLLLGFLGVSGLLLWLLPNMGIALLVITLVCGLGWGRYRWLARRYSPNQPEGSSNDH